jgi:large subunit ribosomal protein L4
MPDNNRSVSAFTALGTARTDKVQLPESTFDGTINMPVMHQAVKAFMANQRQGNASTKIRKYVTGGNQKPWKQKGTGRARQGSTRAPQWVGGGTVFGPTPRPYDEYVPRQVRALAKKSALNARANEGAIFVIDAFNFDAPKTTAMINLIGRLDVADRKVLVLTDGVKPNVFLSGRNIPNVHVMPYSDSSTYHILWSDVLLVEAGALGTTLEPIAEAAAAPTRERAAAPAKPARAAAKKTPAKKSATKAVRKSAPKAAAKTSAKSAKSVAKKSTAKKSAAKKTTKKKKEK